MNTMIRKLGLTLLISIFITSLLNAQTAPKWTLDHKKSSVGFSIKQFLSNVKGNFSDFDGHFYFDPKNLSGSKADFTIEVKSLDTRIGLRDKHLLTSEFFDADTYPQMSFKSTKFENKSGNLYLVHGQLTIKNVTKNVVLPFTLVQEKNTLKFTSSDFKINRKEYDVGDNFSGKMVTSSEVSIILYIVLNQ